MFLDEGLSLLRICLKLREQGIKIARKEPKPSTISHILKNELYTGTCVVNQFCYNEKGQKLYYTDEDGKRRPLLKPAEQHITINVPPLISRSRWELIQEKIKHNTTKSKRIGKSRDYWLRDSLTCDICGAKLKPHHGSPRKDGIYPRKYGCFWRYATEKELSVHNRERCTLPVVDADELESLVWSELASRLSFGFRNTPSQLETIISPEQFDAQLSELETRLAYLDADEKKLQTRRSRVLAQLDREDFNQEEFTRMLKDCDTELTRIKDRKIEVRTEIDEIQTQKNNVQELSNFITQNKEWLVQIREDLNALNADDKKRVIESLVPGRITIETNPDGSWEVGMMRIVFNGNIFKALADEKKISLDKKDSNPSIRP
jgi:hypothetical protein